MENALLQLMIVTNLHSTPLPATIEPVKPPTAVVQQVETPKPAEYTVVEGDTLTKIGETNNSSWLRLWQKNLQITDPDVINAGDVVTVPLPEEVLADRPLPVRVAPVAPVQTAYIAPETPNVRTTPRGSSVGNTYTPGNCTWYVKNRRPDIPNGLGNADTWTIRARNQGIGTGNTPVPGAVGQLGMHVVYVESVNGSQMTISEMNRRNLYEISSRTLDYSGWNFIY